MKTRWKVIVGKQPGRSLKSLPSAALKSFGLLLKDLSLGPIAPKWPNYGKLGKLTHHCHLKKGRPTYVACWTVDKQEKIIEVYYVGTHEKAPY